MLITNKHYRQNLKNKKRIVIKVGSSSLVHPETGETDLLKLEQLVRVLCDLRNQGKDVVLVSSGAIGVGRKALGLNERPKELAQKQACASVGQGMLMMIYQKLFNEYSHVASQILMTKHTIVREKSLHNARNTFNKKRILILRRIICIQAINIRQQNQQICTGNGCHYRRQGIIVTNLNLIR